MIDFSATVLGTLTDKPTLVDMALPRDSGTQLTWDLGSSNSEPMAL